MKKDITTPPNERLRPHRLGRAAAPSMLARLKQSDSPWYESSEDLQRAIERNAERTRQLEWVRTQMTLILSDIERRCIILYYFEGLSYRDAAARTGQNPSSVHRAVQRGIRKLRNSATETRWFKA